MSNNRHNINIVAGEPISRVITYQDPDDVAINLTAYYVICNNPTCTPAIATKLQTRSEAEALANAHDHDAEVIPVPRMFANTVRTYQRTSV